MFIILNKSTSYRFIFIHRLKYYKFFISQSNNIFYIQICYRLSPPSPGGPRRGVTQPPPLSSSRAPPPVPTGGRPAPAIPNRPGPGGPPPARATPGLPPPLIPS